eukprot:TRINITY_DN11013_c0_g4_i5.p1 TRINITY_DN11013_c0_g4~~TRINITY_DN11013_c0_g4_i5.p1  ORF type:complete len:645 (+),score=149.76 TRINITY_DN11013_c0_g4_i5:102-2036(+)
MLRLGSKLPYWTLKGSYLQPQCLWRYASSGVRKSNQVELDLEEYTPDKIRNFSIIAHIDHGKSTIADRLLELTGTIRKDGSNKQVLDKLQVERERGITVKAQTASSFWQHNGERYLLNLIDTPGHVDFNYEVACSLAACQGTLLVVDAAQGVQAQTLANFYLAFEKELTVVPVLNKIDLQSAQIDRCLAQLESLFDIAPEDVIMVSGKSGLNIEQILGAVIDQVPAPTADRSKHLSALLFDSWYDEYRGVVALMEIVDGSLRPGDKVTSAASGLHYDVQDVGIMHPEQRPVPCLHAGQVGYVVLGIKKREEARVGDTFYIKGQPVQPLPGFKPAKSMVFAGLYPLEQIDFEQLASALERLVLNDPSVTMKRDVSAALGPGWRLGFLGMLHMEVFSQRLEQEYHTQVLLTAPSVSYQVMLRKGELIDVESPAQFPAIPEIDHCLEPMVLGTLVFPNEYMGAMLSLCEGHRGVQKSLSFIDEQRVMIKYELPLAEVVEHFYDQIKAASSGYATFDYEEIGYQVSDLVKVQLLLNGEPVDALSLITHSSRAYDKGKSLCQKLKDTIPRQLFDIAIQATAKNRVIARETVKALRKDVTAKCYGGDITRKRKLLSRQKEGKKRMRSFANVQLPKVDTSSARVHSECDWS